MKYIRLCCQDVSCNWKKSGIILVLSFLGVQALCGGYGSAVNNGVREQAISGRGTFLTVLAYLLAGTKYIKLTERYFFSLPIAWCLLYVVGLYMICDFPFQMLEKTGNIQILKLGSQRGWWLEKMAWSIISLIMYIGALLSGIGCYCIWNHISFSGSVDVEIFRWIHLYGPDCTLPDHFWLYQLGIAPLSVLLSLTAFQMAVSQAAGPIGGFAAAVSVAAASMVDDSPWLVGNLGMILRNRDFTDTGINSAQAMRNNIIFGIVSFGIWLVLTGKKEALPKEREAV